MSTRAASRWRAATVAFLAGLALLGLPQAAHADTVVTRSPSSTIELSAATAAPGQTVTFTLTINNNTGTAKKEDLSASFDLGVTGIFDEPGGCTVLTGPTPRDCGIFTSEDDGDGQKQFVDINCRGACSIPANSSLKVAITTTVANGAAPGIHTLTPREVVAGGAFTPGTFTFTVSGQADLAVGLAATAGIGTITYAQTTHNNGPLTATSGTVTSTLPSQTTAVTGLPGNCSYNSTAKTVACTLTNLGSGSTQTNTFTANLNLLSIGSLPASATRTTSSPTDPNTANDTATANCSALLGLIVTC
ncbi:hypothetical protein AB0I39_06625 [Kitasatospora purpeofusca]|uniref:hypothetical protein n=1 Tax=Kitasatospora purpeofusca TaxID=67352 RepID=UPI00340064B8